VKKSRILREIMSIWGLRLDEMVDLIVKQSRLLSEAAMRDDLRLIFTGAEGVEAVKIN